VFADSSCHIGAFPGTVFLAKPMGRLYARVAMKTAPLLMLACLAMKNVRMSRYDGASRLLPCLCLAIVATAAADDFPYGNVVIRAPAGGSEIVITTTPRVAGAIHSLTWMGKEFIDSQDHGRQLQSASNLDAGIRPIADETFNPTEAGSLGDGAGPASSSRLLHIVAGSSSMQSTSSLAFWLAPGGNSRGKSARNTTILSNHLLTKRVSIGYPGLPQVISYDVCFSLPLGEHHTEAVFEALTGYMPAEFSAFHQFIAATGKLESLTDGPGEQANPVVLAVPDGTHAMGIFAPPQPAAHATGPGYGRFRFAKEKVVKWNCVFRVRNPSGVPAGEYSYRMFVVVGNISMVRDAMVTLHHIAAK
jgi:hypothetical protein